MDIKGKRVQRSPGCVQVTACRGKEDDIEQSSHSSSRLSLFGVGRQSSKALHANMDVLTLSRFEGLWGDKSCLTYLSIRSSVQHNAWRIVSSCFCGVNTC